MRVNQFRMRHRKNLFLLLAKWLAVRSKFDYCFLGEPINFMEVRSPSSWLHTEVTDSEIVKLEMQYFLIVLLPLTIVGAPGRVV